MIRQHLVAKGPSNPRFRWRGLNVSRLENLADVAFAFALGTIVISSNVPTSVAEFLSSLRELPAFLASFAIIVMFWFFHYWHHRRYGLEDTFSTVLNFVLLFVILWYAFPLKMLFTALFAGLWSGEFGRLVHRDGTHTDMIANLGELQTCMAIYAGGFALVFALFGLMTVQAYRHRERLELDDIEVLETRETIEGHVMTAGFATVLAIAALLSRYGTMFAGPAFALLGPLHFFHGKFCKRRRAALNLVSREAATKADD